MYAHLCQDGPGLVIDPGVPNSCLPPVESSSRAVDKPAGSAEEIEKILQKTS